MRPARCESCGDRPVTYVVFRSDRREMLWCSGCAFELRQMVKEHQIPSHMRPL